MEKMNYKKELKTETNEKVHVSTYDNDRDIYIRLYLSLAFSSF